MKKHLRQVTGALLALTVAVSLTGCGSLLPGGESPAPSASLSPSPIASPTPSPSAGAAASPSPSGSQGSTGESEFADTVETTDVVEKLVGVPRTTPVMEVNGVSVDAEEFFYWLGYFTENVAYNKYGGPTEINWEDEIDGTSLTTALLDSATQACALYAVVRSEAEKRGLTLSEEDRDELEGYLWDMMQQEGGEDAYRISLEQIGRSDAGLKRMLSTNNYLYTYLQEELFPVGEISDEDLAAWAEENGKMQVKHILFKTVDDSHAGPSGEETPTATLEGSNTSLPEEEVATAKEKAEATLAELQAAEDLETLFDEKMNALSEDGRTADGALAAPDGYFFGEGEMVSEFEEAAKALGEHEMSGLVETPYGYHIILRLPIDPDMARETWEKEAESESTEKMSDQVQTWLDEAEIVTTETVDNADVQAFYEGLVAYRETLEPEEPEPTPTPTPTEPVEK